MKNRYAVFALAAIAVPAFSAQYTFDLKPENTKIEWTLSDVLHTVHGAFDLKRGDVNFDPATGAAWGQVVVDVTSGRSGSETRDRRMHASVLESAKYPEAVFTPDRLDGKLAMAGTSQVKLHGIFRIHGVGHEMTMGVQTRVQENQLNAAITFDVPYVAWGMKDPSNFVLKVNKSVQIAINAEGILRKQ